MHKIKVLSGLAVLLTVSFVAGAATSFYFMEGLIERLYDPMERIDRHTIELMEDWALARFMYQGNDDEALETVNRRIDSNVLVLGNVLSDIEREPSRKNAVNAIGRVHKQRMEHPYRNDDAGVRERIDGIFEQYAAE